MTREKKKRMMPRHILTAAVLIGLIPSTLIAKDELISAEELKILETQMTPKRPT